MDKRASGTRSTNRPSGRQGARVPLPQPSWKRWLTTTKKLAAAAGVLLILLVWALWPSPYSKVINLASRGTNIIAFGDSLTAGYGAAPGEDYPSRLTSLIGVPVLNAG